MYPQYIFLRLSVFEILWNKRQINSQHCYTMLTCLNLAYSVIKNSLQSMHEDCLLLNLIYSLYKVSFHMNLYVFIFNFSNHVSGLLHTILCVCRSAAKDTHFFWSRFVPDSAFVFVLSHWNGKHVHIWVSLSISPHIARWELWKWISLEFYIRKLHWNLSTCSSFGWYQAKKDTCLVHLHCRMHPKCKTRICIGFKMFRMKVVDKNGAYFMPNMLFSSTLSFWGK